MDSQGQIAGASSAAEGGRFGPLPAPALGPSTPPSLHVQHSMHRAACCCTHAEVGRGLPGSACDSSMTLCCLQG